MNFLYNELFFHTPLKFVTQVFPTVFPNREMKNKISVTYQTSTVLFGAAIAEEGAVFSVRDVVVFVANFGADVTDTHSIHHLTRVTMVPKIGKKLWGNLFQAPCDKCITALKN